jgi:hypothetical protein
MTLDQMRAEIDRLWDVYCQSPDPVQVEAAHETWSMLVAQLRAMTVDRTTRRVARGL